MPRQKQHQWNSAATATGIGHSASKGNTMRISTQLAFDIIIVLEGAALGGGGGGGNAFFFF
jgi:hypothetical protein